MSIFTGQTSAHAPHSDEANGSLPAFFRPEQVRRQDRADRAGIDPAVGPAAHAAIDRAIVQARPAADAMTAPPRRPGSFSTLLRPLSSRMTYSFLPGAGPWIKCV